MTTKLSDQLDKPVNGATLLVLWVSGVFLGLVVGHWLTASGYWGVLL
jgi:hypothetical protein